MPFYCSVVTWGMFAEHLKYTCARVTSILISVNSTSAHFLHPTEHCALHCFKGSSTPKQPIKGLLRWYWAPARIAKLNPSYSDRCFRGCGQQGDEMYIWWSCSHFVGFWSRVFWASVHPFTIRKDAKLALLHCPNPGLFLYQQKLATYIIMAAKHTIARAWKKMPISFVAV